MRLSLLIALLTTSLIINAQDNASLKKPISLDLKLDVNKITEGINAQSGVTPSDVKYLRDIKTHQFVAGLYVNDLENKIVRVGNLNFPEIFKKNTFRLTMDIGINADGSVNSIFINKSSGDLDIDLAAKKIVLMSAPFPPLPKVLLKQLKVLVISRVFEVSDTRKEGL